MKGLVCALGAVMFSGCLHAAEFLPTTGTYELSISDADGSPTQQTFEVVSDSTRSAAVFLPTAQGVAPLCLANADRSTCERALGALTLGRLHRVDQRGIATTAAEVLFPAHPSVGYEWEIFRDGVCVFKKRVRSAGADEVVIDDLKSCAGKESVRGKEVWRKGVGLVEMQTDLGVSARVTRLGP